MRRICNIWAGTMSFSIFCNYNFRDRHYSGQGAHFIKMGSGCFIDSGLFDGKLHITLICLCKIHTCIFSVLGVALMKDEKPSPWCRPILMFFALAYITQVLLISHEYLGT